MYNAVVQMANSTSLQSRIAACAAVENVDNPLLWASENAWKFAATPQWSDKWQYASDTLTIDMNPDLGARSDVINDGDILAAVQANLGVPS